MLNKRYYESLKHPDFEFGTLANGYYPTLNFKCDGKWIPITSSYGDCEQLPFCCGVGVTGYMKLPYDSNGELIKMNMAQRDACIARQVADNFSNYNYLIYTGVVGQKKDESHDMSAAEIRQYKLICASLRRLGFDKLAPAYPNVNGGNMIQIMGCMAGPLDELQYNGEDEDWD